MIWRWQNSSVESDYFFTYFILFIHLLFLNCVILSFYLIYSCNNTHVCGYSDHAKYTHYHLREVGLLLSESIPASSSLVGSFPQTVPSILFRFSLWPIFQSKTISTYYLLFTTYYTTLYLLCLCYTGSIKVYNCGNPFDCLSFILISIFIKLKINF